ncbi:MAG: DUF5665 domain-containing protein [bacterium]|nr:DUF5665 domain-containing protein [bacterium]
MQVTPQIEGHLSANMNISKKNLIISNFLGGLAWGFGSVVGATAVVAILGYILKGLGVFSTIGDFFNQISGPFTI